MDQEDQDSSQEEKQNDETNSSHDPQPCPVQINPNEEANDDKSQNSEESVLYGNDQINEPLKTAIDPSKIHIPNESKDVQIENTENDDGGNEEIQPENKINNSQEKDAYHIEADYSTKEGEISIENYDRTQITKFTDHGTLTALKLLGIDSSELFMPPDSSLNDFGDDEDLKKIFISHHNERINRLITLIRRERCKILDQEVNSSLNNNNNYDIINLNKASENSPALSNEDQQTEKMKMRQKKEVEKMLESLFALEKYQNDLAAAEKAESE